MVDLLWQKARFVCFLFALVVKLISSLQISLLRESFELAPPGNLSQEGVTWRLWFQFSSNIFLEEFVLRSLRVSPLMKPFFTPGGWGEVKCVLKRLSRLEVRTHIKNWSPLEIVVSRNVVSVSEISAVNFIVGWWLLACSMNCDNSTLFIVQSENMSSIYRFQTSGRNVLWLRMCFYLTHEDVSKSYCHLFSLLTAVIKPI